MDNQSVNLNLKSFMSVSFQVYVGPYIEAPNPKRTSPRSIRCCPNKSCGKHKKESGDEFCPKCGQKIQIITIQSVKRIDFQALDEDRLFHIHPDWLPPQHEDTAIFQPNQGHFGHHFDRDDARIMAITASMMDEEISRFQRHFVKDIDEVKAAFGDATVKWGVLAYSYWYERIRQMGSVPVGNAVNCPYPNLVF